MSNKSAFDGDPEGVHPGHSEAAPGLHGGMEALQANWAATCRVSEIFRIVCQIHETFLY